MRLLYLFDHPFSISKRFLKERGASDLYTYGETPYSTIALIARECNITEKDHFYDLGSGRGHLCFWLNAFTGCKATGIEEIPAFVERANKVKEKVGNKEVTFKLGNYQREELKEATVLYLFGSNLSEGAIKELIAHLKSVPKGTKIVTVSFPLGDYCSPSLFTLLKRFSAKYQWGTADIYLQVKQ